MEYLTFLMPYRSSYSSQSFTEQVFFSSCPSDSSGPAPCPVQKFRAIDVIVTR